MHEVAASPYGSKRFRTVGLHVDGRLVCSFKRYERELRCGDRTLRAFGIGAVFTPPEERGRGYAGRLWIMRKSPTAVCANAREG